MSNSTLSTLKAVESDLVAQIVSLEEKLQGVRAIIPMFEDHSENSAAKLVETSAEPFEDFEPEESASEEVLSEPDSSNTIDTASEESEPTQAVSQPRKNKAQKAPKSSRRKKKDGRTAAWQIYLRNGAGERPMPEAVLLILQTQPEKPFKVADMMTALFKTADMPRALYLKARSRIANILSDGVRKGSWSRVGNGIYSLSNSASRAA